jgi:hypothetical protein
MGKTLLSIDYRCSERFDSPKAAAPKVPSWLGAAQTDDDELGVGPTSPHANLSSLDARTSRRTLTLHFLALADQQQPHRCRRSSRHCSQLFALTRAHPDCSLVPCCAPHRARREPQSTAHHVANAQECQECHQRILVRPGQSQKWSVPRALLPCPILTPSTATSNDPWGPTGTDMADIAKITYNRSAASMPSACSQN